jgi:hypothetical protein
VHWTHRPDGEHTAVGALQLASPRQPTHRCVVVLQCDVGPLQLASLVQLGTHSLSLQVLLAGQVAMVRHCTHLLLAVLQYEVGAAQLASVTQPLAHWCSLRSHTGLFVGHCVLA